MQGLLFWYPEDGTHMLLMVGLGNPDEKYQGNRHNIGFRVLDEIAGRYGSALPGLNFRAACAKGCWKLMAAARRRSCCSR